MLFNEAYNMQKAGFIPYVIVEDEPIFLFMISSNPAFGGSLPMISKGHVEDGESIKKSAIREAEEELGLKLANVKFAFKAWEGNLAGLDAQYTLTVYAGEVHNQSDFNKPHFETKETVWMSLGQFKSRGRKSHIPIVERLYDKLKGA